MHGLDVFVYFTSHTLCAHINGAFVQAAQLFWDSSHEVGQFGMDGLVHLRVICKLIGVYEKK